MMGFIDGEDVRCCKCGSDKVIIDSISTEDDMTGGEYRGCSVTLQFNCAVCCEENTVTE